MKMFKQLSPQQIARHIKGFQRGTFCIDSLGTFEFSAGRISLHGMTCHQRLKLARQINQAVRQLAHTNPLPDI
ncbi:MAG: DUF1107 family protein [Aeromonas sp.]